LAGHEVGVLLAEVFVHEHPLVSQEVVAMVHLVCDWSGAADQTFELKFLQVPLETTFAEACGRG